MLSNTYRLKYLFGIYLLETQNNLDIIQKKSVTLRFIETTYKYNNLLKTNNKIISEAVYNYHRMANGIGIVYKATRSMVAHSGVFINVGSRDEDKHNEGIAHFIEHAIFKGTTRRKAYHILNRIDGVGGELNAYTTKEETCVYASALDKHLNRCLELFADILFNSTFPEKEIEKEREVILDEINSYKDTPSELIFDEFEEQFFGTHSLAHNILGNAKNIRKTTGKHLSSFIKQNYTTDKMVISVVSNTPFEKVVAMCEKHFGHIAPHTTAGQRTAPNQYIQFEIEKNKHIHQAHALIGCPAYNTHSDKKVAFSLLNNILGGPALNSRLNMGIREKYGLCYNIESQYNPMSDTGIFYIYAAMDADFKERINELIAHEINRLKTQKLSPTQLNAAKQQLIGQVAINAESALSEMQSMGKAFMTFGKVDTIEEINNDILQVTANQIIEAANEVWHDFSRLVFF